MLNDNWYLLFTFMDKQCGKRAGQAHGTAHINIVHIMRKLLQWQ